MENNKEAAFKAYKDLLIAKKAMKKHMIALLIYGSAVALMLYWFDWKFMVVIFMWTWANNISNNSKK